MKYSTNQRSNASQRVCIFSMKSENGADEIFLTRLEKGLQTQEAKMMTITFIDGTELVLRSQMFYPSREYPPQKAEAMFKEWQRDVERRRPNEDKWLKVVCAAAVGTCFLVGMCYMVVLRCFPFPDKPVLLKPSPELKSFTAEEADEWLQYSEDTPENRKKWAEAGTPMRFAK